MCYCGIILDRDAIQREHEYFYHFLVVEKALAQHQLNNTENIPNWTPEMTRQATRKENECDQELIKYRNAERQQQ